MLSIQAFNHLMSPPSATAASRDIERPFKAYHRPSTTLPSSLYPGYSQTFATPGLAHRRDHHPHQASYPAFPSMDFRHHPGYDSSIMDISNATPGNGRGGMSSMDNIKSEMDAMSCASGMPQVAHSQGAHGYSSMASMGGHSHSDIASHHMMGNHSTGGSNGTEPGPSKVSESSGGPSSHSASSMASASGDSPPLPHTDHMGGHNPNANPNKIPPKKRPLQVPDNLKDTQYWEKRKKNNESAKRSREARRMKEEQIAMRVVYLEQENLQLRTEVSLLKSEIEKLRCMLYNS